MNKLYCIALLFAIGCVSESDPENTSFEKNPCVTAGAAYGISYVEVSGTCGPIPAEVIVVPEDGVIQAEASCNKGPRYDGCTVYMENIVCKKDTVDYGEVTVKQSGQMNWAADGSSGGGFSTYTISVPGYESCVSTYEVAAVRL